MSNFLEALKSDLLDRRLLPFVALAVVALLAAIGYVAVGGGSSSTPTTPVPGVSLPPGSTGGLAVSKVAPEKAVAETTDGSAAQRQGAARDPFAVLPGVARAKAAAAAASAAAVKSASTPSAGAGSSATGGSGSSPTSSGGSTPATPSEPVKPAKPQTIFHVAVLFGITPAATTPPGVPLTSHQNLKLQTPLPTATQPLIVYRGVTAKGRSATFTLLGEAILHGTAACLPSPSQCQAIDLRPGQTEQLEFLEGGQTITYELKVVSITPAKASTAEVKRLLAKGASKQGLEILRRAGVESIPYLRYSSQVGVLVFASRGASAARAHTAAARRRGR